MAKIIRCFTCFKVVELGVWNCDRCKHVKEVKNYWKRQGLIMDDSLGLDSRYTGSHPQNLDPEVWDYHN